MSVSVKQTKRQLGYILGIALTLLINLGSITILTILSLLIHEHGISLRVFRSLISVIYCSFQCTGLTPLKEFVKFIPKHCFVFDIAVHGIIPLNSFSDRSLLVHKNKTKFWISILHSATLLNSFICSNSFSVDPLGFPICKIIAPASIVLHLAFLSRRLLLLFLVLLT